MNMLAVDKVTNVINVIDVIHCKSVFKRSLCNKPNECKLIQIDTHFAGSQSRFVFCLGGHMRAPTRPALGLPCGPRHPRLDPGVTRGNLVSATQVPACYLGPRYCTFRPSLLTTTCMLFQAFGLYGRFEVF